MAAEILYPADRLPHSIEVATLREMFPPRSSLRPRERQKGERNRPRRRGRQRERPSAGRRRGPAAGRARAGPRPAVAVFAKAPEPGQVKTRLIPVLHAHEAADLHRALLLDTLDIVEGTRPETVVAFTPATGRRALERLLGRRRRLLPQGPGDLGQRLANVTGQLLSGSRRPVLAVGSDCPALTATRLHEAAAALDGADVVLGPALDGGYYLVGLRRSRPEIFTDIPWGSDRVLASTLRRIDRAGLSHALLQPARDLDTPEDLFEWYAGALGENLRERYPRTWRVLHTLLPPRRFAALEASLSGGVES